MLILCKSFLKFEFNPLRKYFSIKHLINSAHKAKSGLGRQIGGMNINDGELRKIYLTSKSAPARIVFLVNIKEALFIPVLFRLKNNFIGQNMTNKNPDFVNTFKKSLAKIRIDLENGNFDIEKI